MRRQITQKEKDLVVQLYASRFKIDDIVSLTKLSPSTINRITNDANLKKRKSTKPLNETLENLNKTIEKVLSTLEFILQELSDLKKNGIRNETNGSRQELDEESSKDESGEDDDIFLSLSEIKQKKKKLI